MAADRRKPRELIDHPDRWVAARTFRQLLDMSERQFQRAKSAGRLPAAEITFGREARWRWQTVKQFLEAAGTDAARPS